MRPRRPLESVILGIMSTMLIFGCRGANILLNANLGEGSHFLGASFIGESLVARGHNVSFLISNAHAYRARDTKYSQLFNFVIFRHGVPVPDIHKRYDDFNRYAFHDSLSNTRALFKVVRDGGSFDCQTLLSDDEILEELRQNKYDVILFDMAWPCGLLFSKKVGDVPYIVLSMLPSPSSIVTFAGTELNPSYVPNIGTGLTNEMSFLQRVSNTLFYHFLNSVFRRYFYKPFDDLMQQHGIVSPTGNVDGLFSNASLWLVNSDFAVEYPVVLPPNVVSVGGLTTRPAQPLADDLEEFVQSAGDDGVIVCSFGTYFTSAPPHIVEAFAVAFGRLRQKVIWQLANMPSFSFPSNIRVLPWLPQNDLLGHNKTRAFLYQGGNNGFYEAVYHGVPIVVMPIHGDQFDVAALIEAVGLGLKLDKLTVTSDVVYDALQEVIVNSKYKDEASARSAIFRDKPLRPADRAAFWVEHVVKHGGRYLQSPATKHGFVRTALLDVYAFLVIILIVVVYVVTVSCRFVCRRISKDKYNSLENHYKHD